MASKPSSPGFLAKVAQLVRAAPADTPDSQDSEQSDFAPSNLQARIDGKRRDDQVRRREFEHLRKIRASANAGVVGWPPASAFQVNSSFNPEEMTSDDRAHTVKKIDAIEAHMSANWVQRKPGPPMEGKAERRTKPPQDVPVLTQISSTSARTITLNAASPKPSTPPPEAPTAPADGGDSEMDLDFTSYLNETAAFQAAAPEPVASSPAPVPAASAPVTAKAAKAANTKATPAAPARKDAGHSSGFSESRLESHELGLGTDNPALQDAAFRFAEGDFAGAEAALLAVVQDPAGDADQADACACAVLDLYRATDQSASFDVVAIEYAQRFGRSAPEWYSIPMLLKQAAQSATPTAPVGKSVWTCPPLLDTTAVAQMAAAQHGSTRHLNWSNLKTIAPDAVPALTRNFTQWTEQPLALVFGGVEVLNAVLEAATVVEQRDTVPGWWLLRMEALRIQGLHELFETVALDYCITYDVSPPSWLEADCTFSVAATEDAGFPKLDADSVLPSFVDTRAPDSLELRGELLGDAVQALDKLMGRNPVGEPLVIHCQKLMRVDFSAAGSMLNWFAQRRAEGVEVELVQVPRLIGVFLMLMGIGEQVSLSISTK